MKCYRRILRIRWEQKITNDEVRIRERCSKSTIQQIMERKTKLVWTHMQNGGQQVGEGGDVWNDGRRIEKSKIVQRMAG